MRTESRSHLRRVRTHHAPADDQHFGGQNPGHPAQQDAAAAKNFLEVFRAFLHRHASRDFTHGREERQLARRQLDGLVRNRDASGLDDRLGQGLGSGKVEVGEKHLTFADLGPLRLNRLFHFEDQVRLAPHRIGGRCDLGSRVAVRVVAEAGAEAGAAFHEHRVPVAAERFGTRRHERDAVLGGFDFLRYADDHAAAPPSPSAVTATLAALGPSVTIVWRSGAKNSAAIADTSSAVSAATMRNTSSRLRYASPYTAVLAKRYMRAVGLSSDSISCPRVGCFASSSASPRSPSRPSRADSTCVASTASAARAG